MAPPSELYPHDFYMFMFLSPFVMFFHLIFFSYMTFCNNVLFLFFTLFLSFVLFFLYFYFSVFDFLFFCLSVPKRQWVLLVLRCTCLFTRGVHEKLLLQLRAYYLCRRTQCINKSDVMIFT